MESTQQALDLIAEFPIVIGSDQLLSEADLRRKANARIVTTVDEAIAWLDSEPSIALDLETTGDAPRAGLSPWHGRIAVIALYGPVSNVCAVLHDPMGPCTPKLLRWLESRTKDGQMREYLTHNGANFDIPYMKLAGMDIKAVKWIDTLIGEQVALSSGRKNVSVALGKVFQRRLGQELKGKVDHTAWANAFLTQEQMDYVVGDIKYLHAVREEQTKKCSADSRARAMKVEMRLMPVLVDMTLHGMPVDMVELDRYVTKQHLGADKAKKEIFEAFQDDAINLNSPVQIKKAFARLGFEIPSTKVETIVDIAMEYAGTPLGDLCSSIKDYRYANQRIKMFSPAWIEENISYSAKFGARMVHPRFRSMGTDTGRLCVTGDTPVECPRNMRAYPDGIPISEIRPGQLVYSFTWDKLLCLRPVKWVGVTGRRKIIKITLESAWRGKQQTLRITPDHLVRMWHGEWRHAGTLKPGQMLMSMPRRRPTGDDGYVVFGANVERHGLRTKTQGKVWEHRWVYAETHDLSRIPPHYDVHHADGDSFNNEPSNLELLLKDRHMSLHKSGGGPKKRRGGWDDVNAMGFQGTGTSYHVVSIEDAGEEEVWDLEVEDTHTFIGAGVALHNSCNTPNFQQTPRDMRTVFGNVDGWKIVSVDYSAIEVRVAAALANDEVMIEAFSKLDIHKFVASQIFQKPESEITEHERKIAKSATFTLLFGGGAATLQSYAKIKGGATLTLAEAKEIVVKFFQTFQGLAKMRQQAYWVAENSGPVALTLPTGVRRVLIGAQLTPQRYLNTLVQGTAAAFMKYALIACDNTPWAGGKLSDHLCATVHDEIVAMAPDAEAEAYQEVLRDTMINAAYRTLGHTRVPIDAGRQIGVTWAG